MPMPSILPLVTALSISVPTAAGGPPEAPGPWLQKTVEAARKLAERKVKPDSPEETKWKTDVKATVDEILDWDELTKRSLGKAWEARSAEEKKEFSALLRQMVEASYESKLKMAARDQLKKPSKVALTWEPEVVDGTTATARAQVKADKTKATLDFSLRWNDGKWRVYDVAIDDVSTVVTYRTQFAKIISESGFPAVIARMKSKVDEIKAGKSELTP
ncbi:MAG: ABC transporter substrate-binding protein [Myxococcota bacterium]